MHLDEATPGPDPATRKVLNSGPGETGQARTTYKRTSRQVLTDNLYQEKKIIWLPMNKYI